MNILKSEKSVMSGCRIVCLKGFNSFLKKFPMEQPRSEWWKLFSKNLDFSTHYLENALLAHYALWNVPFRCLPTTTYIHQYIQHCTVVVHIIPIQRHFFFASSISSQRITDDKSIQFWVSTRGTKFKIPRSNYISWLME